MLNISTLMPINVLHINPYVVSVKQYKSAKRNNDLAKHIIRQH